MLVDEFPDMGAYGPTSLKGSPVTLHVYVENADAFVARATAAGATVTMPLADMFWGDRYGQLRDPFGHSWSVATHQRDMTDEELQAAAREAMSCA
jgi:PhnB protein